MAESGVRFVSANLRRVSVEWVGIPAWSTLGLGDGIDVDTGERVRFAGDHRPMLDLGAAVEAGEYVEVELEGWQITSVSPA